MLRLRALAAGSVLAAILAVAGCGGGGDGGAGAAAADGADFVPASAPGFIALNTDFESEQWQNLRALVDKFPDRAQLLSQLEAQLAEAGVDWEQDVKPALGPETDVGILRFEGDTGNIVALTQPKDEDKLAALVRKLDEADEGPNDTVTETVDDWTLLSDAQAALTSAKQAHEGDSLADDERFSEAMGDLPDETLATLYFNGSQLQQQLGQQLGGAGATGGGQLTSIAADFNAQEDGIAFDVVVRSKGGLQAKSYSSELAKQAPAGALLFLSFNGLGDALKQVSSNPQLQSQLGAIQGLLGVSATELADLFGGEGALYVRPGAPFPEVTLVLSQPDEQKALSVVDRLAQRAGAFLGQGGAPEATTIAGVAAKKLSFGVFAVYYAGFDGKLVITSSTTGISGLKEGGQKFADDPAFTSAKDGAGMPDETAGFLFVNIKDAIPLIDSFAQTAGQPIPPDVRSNLEPLQTFLAYASSEDGTTKVTGRLEVK